MSQVLNGPDPAPRAWDHVFGTPRDAWIRLRLNDGTWLGGLWERVGSDCSYASGFPYEQDLYLCRTVPVDPDSGAYRPDAQAGPGVLLRWSEVQYLVMDERTPESRGS